MPNKNTWKVREVVENNNKGCRHLFFPSKSLYFECRHPGMSIIKRTGYQECDKDLCPIRIKTDTPDKE
ncbi:MAG: hypothetical protein GY797_38930 [Deltaproteobacteria bacterium]|nr:hypothetical protein [Deltaproteobacteria bacterium]